MEIIRIEDSIIYTYKTGRSPAYRKAIACAFVTIFTYKGELKVAKTNRRDFIRQGLAAGLAFTSTGMVSRKTYSAVSSNFTRVVYRDLGSTGFKASEIGFGVLHITDTSLLHAAIDSGINYFDTAHSYMNGKCEEILGKVMKTRRNEIFLTTKIGRGRQGKMTRDIDTSLKRLQTDCLDLLLLHGAGYDNLKNDDILRVFDTARQQGKTRFVGVSTHDLEKVPDRLVESGFWDALTIPYNYFSPPVVAGKIKNVRDAGIAVIGMKNLITIPRPRKPFPNIRGDKSGEITNQQALLKWVLENQYIDTVIPGISAFEHLEDDIAVMGEKLTFGERRQLRRYSEKARSVYCQGIAGCTGCSGKCPKGVEINELNRCVNYAYGYGSVELAIENYRQLPLSSRVDTCKECEECPVVCVNGLDLSDNIRKARALFA